MTAANSVVVFSAAAQALALAAVIPLAGGRRVASTREPERGR